MYERFTDRARKVMQLANQEAQKLNHEYIGTEHIVLGLTRVEGMATQILEEMGVTVGQIREAVEKIIQPGPDMVTMGKLPQTPRAKRAMQFAMEEARSFSHNYIGTEHLLAGLLVEVEGVAGIALNSLGVTIEKLRLKLPFVVPKVHHKVAQDLVALFSLQPAPPPMHPKSAEFCEILDEMKAMHIAKSADYGLDTDPLHNLRKSEAFGVEPWLATLVRLGDKVTRAETYAQKRSLRNEGFEDTMLDLACYSILVLILFRETLQPSGGSIPDGDFSLGTDVVPHVPVGDFGAD
jgi:hypothetical protein